MLYTWRAVHKGQDRMSDFRTAFPSMIFSTLKTLRSLAIVEIVQFCNSKFPKLPSSENSFLAKCLLLSPSRTHAETCWSSHLGRIMMLVTVLLKQLTICAAGLPGP